MADRATGTSTTRRVAVDAERDAADAVEDVQRDADSAANKAKDAKDQALGRWDQINRKHPSVRRTVAAYQRLQQNNGNLYAGAITYFSFLALFPLLLLGVAILGFVLYAHPAAQETLLNKITSQAPGSLGTTLRDAVKTAIKARAGVGVVGLAGVLLTGLGWIGNLRAAINAVWGFRPAKKKFVAAKLSDLVVLGGLGLGLLISLGLTVVGTGVTDQVLRALNLQSVPGLSYLVPLLGIVLSVAGDMIILYWLLVRLPGAQISRRTALYGTLMGAIGLEILKVAATYLITRTAKSPTAGPFAGVIAILVWIQLVARFILFSAAWMATRHEAETVDARPKPVVVPSGPEGGTPAAVRAVAWSWFGAGAAAGSALAGWAAARRRAVLDRR